MHLARDSGPLGQAQVVALAGLPFLIEKNTRYSGAGDQNRQPIEPAGLIKLGTHDNGDPGLRRPRVHRAVAGDHTESIKALEFVAKEDALRCAKAARREFDLDTPAARTYRHVAGGRNTLAVYQNRFHPNGKAVAGSRVTGLEVDRSLYARKPQLSVRCHTPRWLHATVDLGRFQPVAGSIGQNPDRVRLPVGSGIEIVDGCRGETHGAAHPQVAGPVADHLKDRVTQQPFLGCDPRRLPVAHANQAAAARSDPQRVRSFPIDRPDAVAAESGERGVRHEPSAVETV